MSDETMPGWLRSCRKKYKQDQEDAMRSILNHPHLKSPIFELGKQQEEELRHNETFQSFFKLAPNVADKMDRDVFFGIAHSEYVGEGGETEADASLYASIDLDD